MKNWKEILEGSEIEVSDIIDDDFDDMDGEDFEDMEFEEKCALFFAEIDVDEIPERLEDLYHAIMDEVEEIYLDDDEMAECVDLMEMLPRKKKRIKISDRIKRRREYRKGKAKIKRQQKLRRQKPAYKRFKKKQKRMAKRGRTTTGKRQTTMIN